MSTVVVPSQSPSTRAREAVEVGGEGDGVVIAHVDGGGILAQAQVARGGVHEAAGRRPDCRRRRSHCRYRW